MKAYKTRLSLLVKCFANSRTRRHDKCLEANKQLRSVSGSLRAAKKSRDEWKRKYMELKDQDSEPHDDQHTLTISQSKDLTILGADPDAVVAPSSGEALEGEFIGRDESDKPPSHHRFIRPAMELRVRSVKCSGAG